MSSDSDIKLPNDDQVFGIVTNLRGANKLTVKCMDGEERLGRIPGRMRKKEWINENDLIILEPWDWQDEKGDVVHRYSNKERNKLEENNIISED